MSRPRQRTPSTPRATPVERAWQGVDWVDPTTLASVADRPAARQRLRRQAVALQRTTPERAAASAPGPGASWRWVAGARWTLVDEFEDDGRRFLVAYHPGPAPAGAALTEREARALELVSAGQTNKFIGFELGVSPTTAAAILRSLCEKLGVAGRTELVRVANALSKMVVLEQPA